MAIKLEDLKQKINTRDADKGFEGSSYTFDRALEDANSSNDEKMYLRMTLTSETPVEDWFGFLTLDHSPGAIITDRLQSKSCSWRDGHYGDQVGYIDDFAINANKKLEIGVIHSPHNPRAVMLYKEYRDKIRKNTSARFVVHELLLEKEIEEVPYYRATKWELIHGAAVPDGADPNVGIDRNFNKQKIKGVVTMEKTEVTPQDRALTDAEMDALKTKIKSEMADDLKTAVDRATAEGGEAALKNIAAIMHYRDAYKNELKDVADLDKLANDAIKLRASERQFADKIIELLAPKKSAGSFDIPKNDREKFSPARLILSLADPKEKADHERAVCAAYAKERGLNPQGTVIPREFLMDRTMTVAAPTGGGNLVGTNLMPQMFIPLARNKAVVDQLNVITMPNLVGNPAIPTQTSAIVGGWMTDESTGPSAADLAIGQKTLSPKTFSGTTSFSRQLLLQGTPQVDMLIEDDLQKICNLAKDKSVFHGRGATTYGEPQGLVGTSGVGLTTVKTSFTYADIVAMETVIAAGNLDAATMAYVTTPTLRGTLKTTLKDSGVPGYIWDNNEMNGYRALASNQITAGFVFHGDFSQVVVGEWGGLDIVVDAVTSKVGLIYITAFLSMDVAFRYAGAFSYYKPS